MSSRPLPDRFLVAFSFAGEQRDLVRAIAEEVEKELGRGKVFFDEWYEYYIAGSDADRKLQKIYSDQCELAIVCISERYGGKPWTLAEHEAIRARQMKLRASKDDRACDAILPIRVGDGDVEGIQFNTIVPDVRRRPPQETVELIVDRLRLVVPDFKTSSSAPSQTFSWPEASPQMSIWPMADHTAAREAFGQLLTRNAPWRCLLLRGSSDTGKSHITRQMLANAIGMLDLACGRLDFKGTTGVDAEVRALVQYLGVSEPPTDTRLNERLNRILEVLRQRARPTVGFRVVSCGSFPFDSPARGRVIPHWRPW